MRAQRTTLPSLADLALPSLLLFAAISCGGDGGTSPPVPTTLQIVSGQGQTGEVGTELASPLRIRITDGSGNGLSGVTVSWTAGAGAVSSSSSTTDASGEASVTWTLGTTAGSQSATASSGTLTPATFNATAVAGDVATVTVTPSEAALQAPGGTAALTADARDEHGNVVTDASFTWDSDDEAVATVDGTGTVTAVGAGTATVSATADGVSGSAEITVVAVGSVEVDPDVLELEEGESGSLTATVRDTDGEEVTSFEVTWSSSDESVATVDDAGNVTAGVAGQATITATAGGVEGTAQVVVAAEAFNPTEDTEISGTLSAGSMDIPGGVTVTVTDDAVLQIAGDAVIDGTLTGDCVGLDLEAGGDVTITGTVGNVCDQVDPGEEDPPALSIVGDGTLTVEGDLLPAGDYTLKNSPELQESDFDFSDDDEAAVILLGEAGAMGGRAAVTRAPSHTQPCFIRNRDVGPADGDAGDHAKDGFSRDTGGQVGDGYSGGNGFIACAGDLELTNTKIRGQGGGDGGDAGDPTDPASTKDTDQSRAGNGGNGGNLNIGSNGKIQFNGTTLKGRDGGDGGDAFHQADQPGESSLAVGGKGGTAGTFRVHGKQGINITPSGLLIMFGDGGDGGMAEARAMDGRSGFDQCPAQNGGDGTATGGDAGDSGKGLRHKGNVVGLANVTTGGGEGGHGGSAEARAGDGGDGGRDCVDGADGGATTAQGGHGGDGRSTFDGVLIPSSLSGVGGDADFLEGGNGGDGYFGCTISFLSAGLAGGDGGDGGSILGGTGAAGEGAGVGTDGTWTLHITVGEGGDGGVGLPPGDAGKGGHASIADPRSKNTGPARAPLEQDQPDGEDGKEDTCQGPAAVDVKVGSDASDHEKNVGMLAVIQVLVTLFPGGTASITGSPPWIDVTGGFGTDAIINATGSGTAAGFPGIMTSFTGPAYTGLEGPPAGGSGAFQVTVLPPGGEEGELAFELGPSTLEVGTGGGLPGGESVTYIINGDDEGDPEKPETFPDFDPSTQLYSAESHWNTPIPEDPDIDPASATYVGGLMEAGDPVVQLGQYSATVFFADGLSALRTVELPCGPWWELGVGEMADVPVPPFAEPADDTDGEVPLEAGECGEESDKDNHMVILDLENGCEYDFWQARMPDGGVEASWGAAIPLDSDGVYPHGLSTRGSGFPFLGGVIFPGELEDGEINHALAFSYPFGASGGPVAPATDSDGVSDETFALPEGAHIQLDPDLDLDGLGLSDAQRTIARTLQTHGAFLVDVGGESGIGFYGVDPSSAQTNPYASTLGDDDFPSAFPASLLEHMRVLELPPQDPDFQDNLDLANNACVDYR